jgi:hypothetical protein
MYQLVITLLIWGWATWTSVETAVIWSSELKKTRSHHQLVLGPTDSDSCLLSFCRCFPETSGSRRESLSTYLYPPKARRLRSNVYLEEHTYILPDEFTIVQTELLPRADIRTDVPVAQSASHYAPKDIAAPTWSWDKAYLRVTSHRVTDSDLHELVHSAGRQACLFNFRATASV